MFYERTIKKEIIYSGRVVEVLKLEVELPNKKTSIREIVNTTDSVAIITLTSEGEIVLVRQFRKACEQVLYEIPAGCIENFEEPADCARRELLEETGYGGGTLTLVNKVYPSVGTNGSTMYIYMLTDAKKLSDKLSLDDDEFLEVVTISFDKFTELYCENKILDMKTAFAYIYLRGVI